MKNIIIKATVSTVLAASLMALAIIPASAQTAASVGINASASITTNSSGTGTSVGVGISAKAKVLATVITNATTRADQEITRRVNSLNALSTRVNAMVKVSASDKASLSSTIETQITAMNTLQAQIAADATANSTSSLKADIQSITKSYRIFALVIPQGAIEAAADRVMTITGLMTQLTGTLQTRITAAQSAGVDMTTSVSALADMNAKIADANTQAQAAVSETASLQPDNGVQSVMASNTAALKDAHTKIQAAQQDLVTARADAGTIVKALLAVKVSASASSTTSASSSL
ncbi:MAG TPA: hypothetical protein VHZ04_02205 [Candidatus Paceibacterota bacterium]|jgi:hypothetical protein|nr:hypothetical protein [Candidatus Paceibacterota bacterium]